MSTQAERCKGETTGCVRSRKRTENVMPLRAVVHPYEDRTGPIGLYRVALDEIVCEIVHITWRPVQVALSGEGIVVLGRM